MRAEQRKGTQARLAQFFLVRAQRRNNSLGRMHDKHCSTREKRKESVFGLLLNGPSVALKTQISAHRQVRNRVEEGRVGGLPSEPLLADLYNPVYDLTAIDKRPTYGEDSTATTQRNPS